jgi:hypothetical protein
MSKLRPTVDLGYPTEARGKIPSFANIEEEAEFWDTHDFTDFLDESAPANIEVAGELKVRVERRAKLAAKARTAKAS